MQPVENSEEYIPPRDLTLTPLNTVQFDENYWQQQQQQQHREYLLHQAKQPQTYWNSFESPLQNQQPHHPHQPNTSSCPTGAYSSNPENTSISVQWKLLQIRNRLSSGQTTASCTANYPPTAYATVKPVEQNFAVPTFLDHRRSSTAAESKPSASTSACRATNDKAYTGGIGKRRLQNSESFYPEAYLKNDVARFSNSSNSQKYLPAAETFYNRLKQNKKKATRKTKGKEKL